MSQKWNVACWMATKACGCGLKISYHIISQFISHVWRYETCFVLSSLFISQRTNKKLWFQSLCQNLDGAAAAAPSCSLCLDFDDGTKPPSHQLWPTIKPLRYNLTNLKTGWHRPHIAPRRAAYLASVCQFNTNPAHLWLNTEKTC